MRCINLFFYSRKDEMDDFFKQGFTVFHVHWHICDFTYSFQQTFFSFKTETEMISYIFSNL